MHIIGVAGHPRRYADPLQYDWLNNLQGLNQFISVSAFVLGIGQLIFLVNFFYSLFWGPKAGRNPWHANTLEWTAPSPPPHGNFETPPIVYRGPYEYASPESTEDYLPQTLHLNGKAAESQPAVHH
jgi:cytochrome c oxidase subunit 1